MRAPAKPTVRACVYFLELRMGMKRCFGSVLACAMLAALAGAEGPVQPGGRNKPGFAYDEARKKFVLFGGFDGTACKVCGDTYEWDGARWIRHDVPGPSPRAAMAMAYDGARKTVVLFGGTNGTDWYGDTWEWDGTAWSRLAVEGPAARSGSQMAFDDSRKKMVMFGGIDKDRKLFGETWEWGGGTWREAVASTAPDARVLAFLAYDSARRRIVMFGGNKSTMPPPDAGLLGDTWEWDGTKWEQFDGAAPGKRDHYGMAYDDARHSVVLFGGWNQNYLGDTWERAGTEWKKAAISGPSARGGSPSMAYDRVCKKVVLFGGWDVKGPAGDVWEWDGARWEKVW